MPGLTNMNAMVRSRNANRFGICSLTSLHELAECREPFRKTLLLEMIGPTVTFRRRAVEGCPPFDGSLVALDDRRNADCRDVVADRKGRGIANRLAAFPRQGISLATWRR